MTTAVAEPLSTLEPRKQRLGRSSGFSTSAGAGSALRSTGKASPVSAAWFRNRSLAESTRTSAGTISPAARWMMSPGTKSLSGISASVPPRTTVAVLLTIAWSFSAALSARISWKKRSTTPSTTMTKMTTMARRSPVRKEITPSATSRMTNGSLTLCSRRIKGDWRFSRAISFGPTCFKRASASAWLRPSGRDASSCRTGPGIGARHCQQLSGVGTPVPAGGWSGVRRRSRSWFRRIHAHLINVLMNGPSPIHRSRKRATLSWM